MEDRTKGYKDGDKCPRCGGLVTIRTAMGSQGNEKPKPSIKYAQCAKCYWNTM